MLQNPPVRRIPRLYTLALLAATLGASACTDSAPATGLHARVTGEEAFRGLVLGEGAVAQQLPEIWANLPAQTLSSEQQAARNQVKAQLIADLRAADATFFTRFASDVQSGDHLRIERALEDSAGLVKQVVSAQSAPKSDPISTCVAVTLAVVGNVVAVVNVAVAGNLVYTVNWFWDNQSVAAGGQLAHDQVVDMIATRLYAPPSISE